MPTVISRRGQPSRPSHRKDRDDTGKIVSSLAAVILAGFVLYQSSGSKPSTHDASSMREDAPQHESLPPPGHTIKGNISVATGAKLYHVPGMEDYVETVIDTRRGERWFRTEAEAVANGWRKAPK